MKCEDLRQQLPDYTLGTLSETETAAVRRHLRGCAACRAEADKLDQGVALFASVAHAVEPPAELKQRVMSVLADEWRETEGRAWKPPRRGVVLHWQALAAAFVILAGILVFAGYSQARAGRFQQDASSYRQFLHSLGGEEVRVATLKPSGDQIVDGSAILYDSDKGQSWVLVIIRAPGLSQPIRVTLSSPGGHSIRMPFPLQPDAEGGGSTWLLTSTDISRFNQVQLTAPDGSLVAAGTATAEDH
jgi:Putative zinc-finger